MMKRPKPGLPGARLAGALRDRAARERATGEIPWPVFFFWLFAGLGARLLFGPAAAVVVTLGVLAFFFWWISALKTMGMGLLGCLVLQLVFFLNLAVLAEAAIALLRHKPAFHVLLMV